MKSCHMTKYLFFPKLSLVELLEGSTQSLPKYKMHWSSANFLESSHQCQTDLVLVAGALCFLLASLGKTTYSAPWHP